MKIKALLSLFLLAATTCSAQFRRPMPLNEGEYYDLKVGKASMRIDAANGARIISLKHDTTEVISQNPMPNMYGSTFWTSPQKEWNWPPVREHDIMRYSVEKNGDKLLMTSQLSEKIPLRIKKCFSVDETEQCFVITYSIVNESAEDRKVAPWEITRVPAEGTIFFIAPMESITPAGLMNFVDKNGVKYYEIDQSEKQRKINADGMGWLGYENKGLVLIKRFEDLNASQPAPDEGEIQVYVHNGKVYVELEEQGAYTNLRPGEQLDWTVRWYLVKK
ncbi:MAG: hypothetical protein MJZ32_00380 [Bacteroidaceae bacterium]|nr:hypothetical protein [Bacteroidaceae bacterium]